MENDIDSLRFFEAPATNIWLSPGKLFLTQPFQIRCGYRMIFCDRGNESSGEVGAWNEPGDTEELRKRYSEFDPFIHKTLDTSESCSKWRVAEVPHLSRWSSENGRIVLLGDAAHAMMPHAEQVG